MIVDSLYLLIPIALVFTALAGGALIWAVGSRQYDDLDVEARRILFDDEDNPADGEGPS